jgi:4-azaleucine resistance transporter AzlC
VQFVSVGFLSGGPVLMAGITALMVAARHFFFSISMIGRYRNEGKRKWYLYYALCDETYAMLSRDDIPEDIDLSMYRLLVTFFDQSAWLTGSVLGGIIGGMLTFDSTGIDFAMTALFTTVYVQQWIDLKCHIPAVLGVAATLGCRLVFGRDYFLIPAMVIIIVVLTVMRSRIEPQFDEAAGEAKTAAGEPAGALPQRGGVGDE